MDNDIVENNKYIKENYIALIFSYVYSMIYVHLLIKFHIFQKESKMKFHNYDYNWSEYY